MPPSTTSPESPAPVHQGLTHAAVTLHPQDYAQAEVLEELLWTLPAVRSVTYAMDGEEQFQHLDVIGDVNELASQIHDLLANNNLAETTPIGEPRRIAEEDWAESWKRYWHVTRLLPNLVIRPSWEDFTPEANDTVLHLDPGSAFGTGTHETTQLVLMALQDMLANGAKPQLLMDIGTGSGILAIAAIQWGIPQGVATDNDPQALVVAAENARANNTQDRIRFTGDDVALLADRQQADVVLANILAPVLTVMMPDLLRLIAPGGTLVMSGVTRSQAYAVADTARANGFKVMRLLRKNDWVAIVCERPV